MAFGSAHVGHCERGPTSLAFFNVAVDKKHAFPHRLVLFLDMGDILDIYCSFSASRFVICFTQVISVVFGIVVCLSDGQFFCV